MIFLGTTAAQTQYVTLESDQFQGLVEIMSFQAGFTAFLCLLIGGLLIIEIHRG